MAFKVRSGDSEVTGDFSKLENLTKSLKKKTWVDIGILGGETSPEGGETLASIGSSHEFGSVSNNLPERSFLRMPIEEKAGEIEKTVGNSIESDMAEGNIKRIFQKIGLAAEGQIQEAFETGGFGKWPELQYSTILAKKSSAILIDTGSLRKAVTSKTGGDV